jgi:hypothetical protein
MGNKDKPGANMEGARTRLYLAIQADTEGHGHLSDGKALRSSTIPLQAMAG